jgi:hypothetical protein
LPNSEGDSADHKEESYFTINEKGYEQLCVKRKNGLADTLVDFKKVFDIKSMVINKNLIYVTGILTDYRTSYFAVIKNERIFKEFTLPGIELTVSKTPLNHIYLSNSRGAFLYTKNRLVHVYN